MLKKILSLAAALAIAITAFPLASFASEAPSYDITSERAETASDENADIVNAGVFSVYYPTVFADSFNPGEYSSSIDSCAKILRRSFAARQGSVSVKYVTDNSDNSAVWREVYDYAVKHTGVPNEGDYIAGCFAECSGSCAYYFSNGLYYYELTYEPKFFTTAAQEAELSAEIDKVLSKLNLWNKSDYEKVRGLYDYITRNVSYDFANLNDSGNKLKHTAYAALINKTAVCQGYAMLFYRLALELGVDARYITGIGEGGAHGWNIVKIGDYYYNIDATWDASMIQSGDRYHYFLKCPQSFDADHTRDSSFTTKAFNSLYPMAPQDYSSAGEWILKDPGWYLYINGVMQTGWKLDCGKWYYLGSDGIMRTGWQLLGGKWYYLAGSGAMATGWQKINGKWYYLNGNGVMLTGWQKLGGKWYFLNSNGAMATGWQKISGKWYYLNGDGVMLTGWEKLGGKWYFLNSNGAMATGWQKISGKWYYLNGDGVMLTGWQKLGGKWYFLNADGAMVTGRKNIGGKIYTFNSSGVWVA